MSSDFHWSIIFVPLTVIGFICNTLCSIAILKHTNWKKNVGLILIISLSVFDNATNYLNFQILITPYIYNLFAKDSFVHYIAGYGGAFAWSGGCFE